MLVINASPNKAGNSVRLAERFLSGQDYQILHLVDFQVSPYGQVTDRDEFFAVYELFAQADEVLLVSPIYWWNVSGLLKNFMDRFADVPYPPKELRKKKIYLLLQGSQPGDELSGLDYSFKRFCRNYGMSYQGMAVTNYELKDVDGWEVEKLGDKLKNK